MLRYHKFTIGTAWLPEYGNPEEEADFEFIFKFIIPTDLFLRFFAIPKYCVT